MDGGSEVRRAQQKVETECLLRKGREMLLGFQGVLERQMFVDLDSVEFSVILFSETNLLNCWIGIKVEKRHAMHGQS